MQIGWYENYDEKDDNDNISNVFAMHQHTITDDDNRDAIGENEVNDRRRKNKFSWMQHK